MPGRGGRPLRDRPTADLIVIFLAGLVGFVVVFATVGVIALELSDYHINTDFVVGRIYGIVNTLVGAVIGYVAGKSEAARRREEDQD